MGVDIRNYAVSRPTKIYCTTRADDCKGWGFCSLCASVQVRYVSLAVAPAVSVIMSIQV